jgi:nucleoside-diphosphate-sugar epimerase
MHGLGLVCVRLGSVIGPWERDTGVRDTLSTHFQLARMAARGEAAVLPAREFRRDWVYCRDVARAIADLLQVPSPGHALYNISSDRVWGGLEPWCRKLKEVYPAFEYRVAREGERTNLGIAESQHRGIMDIRRLGREIGYRPKYGPDQAYEDYAQWLRAYGHA